MAGRFMDRWRLGVLRARKKRMRRLSVRRPATAKTVGSTCDLETAGDFLEAMGMSTGQIQEIIMGFLQTEGDFDPEAVVKKRLGSKVLAFWS